MEDKVEKYFKILYPKYDELTQEEKDRLISDKKIIEENIEKIDEYYKKYKISENNDEIENNAKENEKPEEKNEVEDSGESECTKEEIDNVIDGDNQKEREILLEILVELKVNKYFNLLYPEYETLTEEEKIDLIIDKSFIEESIEAIDEYYKDCKTPGCGAELMDWSDQQIIETALRLFKKQEQGFTKEDIEQLTGSLRIENLKQATANIRGTSEEQEIEISNDPALLDDK